MTAVATAIAADPAEPPWNRLGRPSLGIPSTPLATALMAGLTFGLLPAVVWPLRWATFLDRERAGYLDLAHWWRRRVDPAEAQPSDGVLNTLRPRPILVVLPWLAVGFVATVLGVGAYLDGPQHVWAVTYGYHNGLDPASWPAGGSTWRNLHSAWLWTLFAAYAIHWYAVRSHGQAVGDLVRWTNRLTRDNGDRRVRNEAARLGLGPLWVTIAVGACFVHAWWAVPMVLAGAAQRRYADVGTVRLGRALRAQAGEVVATAGGGTSAGPCPAPECGAVLPPKAKFCPRCGSPADRPGGA